MPALRRPTPSAAEVAYAVVTVFAVAFISVFGLVLAGLGALHGYYEQRPAVFASYAALAAIALVLELIRL